MSVPAENYSFGFNYIFMVISIVAVVPILVHIIVPVFYENNISNCYEVRDNDLGLSSCNDRTYALSTVSGVTFQQVNATIDHGNFYYEHMSDVTNLYVHTIAGIFTRSVTHTHFTEIPKL